MKKEPAPVGLSSTQLLSIVATGIGIGWLAGLSLSPVAHVVITSLIGLAAAAVAAFASIELPVKDKEDKEKADGANVVVPKLPRGPVNALPIALLVLSVAGGAPLGILARTHHVFGVQEIASSQKKKEDKDDEKAQRRVTDPGLFVGEGVNLTAAQAYNEPGQILVELKGSKNPAVRRFAGRLANRSAARGWWLAGVAGRGGHVPCR